MSHCERMVFLEQGEYLFSSVFLESISLKGAQKTFFLN